MQVQGQTKESIQEFELVTQLGYGFHSIVYKAINTKNNQIVAIKCYKKQTSNPLTSNNEYQILKALSLQNIPRPIQCRSMAIYTQKNGIKQPIMALIQQFIDGSMLFNYYHGIGRFPESITRYIFKQLIQTLSLIHQKGYAHRDIKLQNILLTNDYKVKIIDFGFSCKLQGVDKSGKLKTKLGSIPYKAPQIDTDSYKGQQIDVFASGVVFFILIFGQLPFANSSPNDPYFKLVESNNWKIFWLFHSKRVPNLKFTIDFMDLFQRMVAANPSDRISFQQIKKHKWYTQQNLPNKQIYQFFTDRREKIRQMNDNAIKKSQENRQILTNVNMRSFPNLSEQFKQIYDEQSSNIYKHSFHMPNMRICQNIGFCLRQKIQYVYPYLIAFLKTAEIPVRKEIQSSQQISMQSPKFRNKNLQKQDNKIYAQFAYCQQFDVDDQYQQQYVGEVSFCIELGYDQDRINKNIIVKFELKKGFLLDLIGIIESIKNEFRYCLVQL